MSPGRAAVALALAAAGAFVPAPPAKATPERQAILVVFRAAPYEEVLAEMPFAALARTGGVGLMTTRGAGEAEGDPVAALSAGATGEDAHPGAIAEAIAGAGMTVGLLGGSPGSPGRALFSGHGVPARAVVELSLDDPRVPSRLPEILDTADLLVVESGIKPPSPEAPEALSLALGTRARQLLVLVVTPRVSRAMREAGDEVTALLMAEGDRDAVLAGLARARGPARASGLTSDTTRREGLVSNADVAPTILEFLGVPVPEGMTGSPIRIEGEPPDELHARYLEYQRIHFPVQIGILSAALLAMLLMLVLLVVLTPPAAVRAASFLALAAVAAPGLALPLSLLPRLTYPVVLPVLLGSVLLVASAGVRFGRGDPVAPVAVVAGTAMAVVAVDGLLGWPAMLMPMIGGSALEGVRFYGLTNSYAGVLLAGTVLLASRVPVAWGTGLLVVAALFAGLPTLGADLGGGVTLFAAAGLWYGVRRWRAGVRVLLMGATAALAGAALLVLAHRYLSPVETHVARSAAGGLGGVVSSFGERFADNLRVTSGVPAAWIAVVALPLWLGVAWRPRGPFRRALAGDLPWRDALVVMGVSAVVGYVVNDTNGLLGMALPYLLAGILFPALEVRWRSG